MGIAKVTAVAVAAVTATFICFLSAEDTSTTWVAPSKLVPVSLTSPPTSTVCKFTSVKVGVAVKATC